ncbi:hypothetical protein TYRP_010430 [Tyrophagus putrescentiae]|nr:hypothetical protein TYRP_010430 [Tyrophagus putrescentiae]
MLKGVEGGRGGHPLAGLKVAPVDVELVDAPVMPHPKLPLNGDKVHPFDGVVAVVKEELLAVLDVAAGVDADAVVAVHQLHLLHAVGVQRRVVGEANFVPLPLRVHHLI